MERKIGDIFKYNEVTLKVIANNGCDKCYFKEDMNCSRHSLLGRCSKQVRSDKTPVNFVKVEDTERNIKLTLERAREFYKKEGELRDLALSAFSKEEILMYGLPKTWEEFCLNNPIKKDEAMIYDGSLVGTFNHGFNRRPIEDRDILPSEKAAEAHLALMQLHQLRDCYRQGWLPKFKEVSYAIKKNKEGNIDLVECSTLSVFLSFQTYELAHNFLKNFKELIEKAGDLI